MIVQGRESGDLAIALHVLTPRLFTIPLIVAGTAGTLAQLLVGRVLQGASAPAPVMRCSRSRAKRMSPASMASVRSHGGTPPYGPVRRILPLPDCAPRSGTETALPSGICRR